MVVPMVMRDSAAHLQRWISRLASLVIGLAVLAAGAGIFAGWGHPHQASPRFVGVGQICGTR
jgi:hypothetical protein